MSLNARQLLFARAYIAEQNATRAAKAAGYSDKCAHAQGHRLLKRADVKAFIDAGISRSAAAGRVQEIEVHGAKVLGELGHIAHSDLINAFCADGTLKTLEQMTPEMRACIASLEFTELFEGASGEKFCAGRIVKLKLWDKPKALEMLGRNQKLFTDKVEVTGKLSLEDLITEAAARGKAKP